MVPTDGNLNVRHRTKDFSKQKKIIEAHQYFLIFVSFSNDYQMNRDSFQTVSHFFYFKP